MDALTVIRTMATTVSLPFGGYMIANNKNNDNEDNSENVSREEGLLARMYERINPAETNTGANYRPKNFLRGSVTSDRLRHENEAQHGGMAHWRQNTNKQRDYDDQVLHGGMGLSPRAGSHAQAAAIAYGSSTRSPGMGLEAENFQSFISGTYQTVAPAETAQPLQMPRSQQSNEETPKAASSPSAATRSDIPLLSVARNDIANYRRKKSLTFTNLLARAGAILNK